MKFRAITDLYLNNGVYVMAGDTFDAPTGWVPATHACDPMDADAVDAYFAVGPSGGAPVWPDTRLRGLSPNELPGGDHSEPRVRVALVVIVEPPGDLPEHRSGIRQWMYASVVALECFDEGFSDAV